MLFALACTGERDVESSTAEAACADGMSTGCADVLFADAAWFGEPTPELSAALLLILDVSPEWYVDTLREWSTLEADPAYGEAVASTRGRRVTLHAPWSRPPELLAAALVHEAAHAARPIQARHKRCDWSTGCDDGDDGDGYVLVARFVAESGWSTPLSEAIFVEANQRSNP